VNKCAGDVFLAFIYLCFWGQMIVICVESHSPFADQGGTIGKNEQALEV